MNIEANDGGVLFLFGAFCALWAQNTGRNAWLWFFLGLFFSVFAVLFLLFKNSKDLYAQKIETDIRNTFKKNNNPTIGS